MLIGSIDGLPPSPASAREGVALSGAAADRAPAGGVPSSSPPVSNPPVSNPSADALKDAVAKANDALRAMSQAVEFEYDPESEATVVRVVDTNDRQVLRQVPAPEMLEIARALARMQSMLIHAKA